ncbi:T9SS type A sorting domain-containing protein [Flavobacterium sp.]|uniref:T9SS type A sorting domain-containing protein n=1 Tax=Flavobacterium sp. TaxID=239 RepID=UPI0039E21F65
MKKLLLLLLAALWSIPFQAQNITKMEYWVDADPGFGQAFPITGFASQSMINNFGFQTMSLSPGAHTIGFRTRDANGRWSHANFVQLYVSASLVESDIVSLEYFWDSDPGFGNGQVVAFSPSETISGPFSADVPPLSVGDHYLFVRSLDSHNRYSHTNYLLVSVPGIGFEDMENESFKIYPNPVEDNLYIDLKKSGKTRLLLYDLSGKVVADEVMDQSTQVPVGHLASGVYSVYLWTSENTIYTAKIIKK